MMEPALAEGLKAAFVLRVTPHTSAIPAREVRQQAVKLRVALEPQNLKPRRLVAELLAPTVSWFPRRAQVAPSSEAASSAARADVFVSRRHLVNPTLSYTLA